MSDADDSRDDSGSGDDDWSSHSERWEDTPSEWDGDGDEDEDSDESENEAIGASKMLVDLLLELLFAGRMSAKLVCVICWWAWRAGARGADLQLLARHPDSQTGKFQHHVDKYLGVSTRNSSYKIRLPTRLKGNIMRTMEEPPVELVSELLEEEIENIPEFDHTLEDAVAARRLPNSYFEHEVYEWNRVHKHHTIVRMYMYIYVMLCCVLDRSECMMHSF